VTNRRAHLSIFLTLTLLFSGLMTIESHAAETLVVKTIQDSPLMPVAKMSYTTIPNPNGSGVIESYTSPTGLPMLSQIEFGFWGSPAGIEDDGKYAWAADYSTLILDVYGLPFPSPNRISLYRALIYNDSLVLYHFDHPILPMSAFYFCSKSPNQTFSKGDVGLFAAIYYAGYLKCSDLPSIQNYMKQFIVRQIPLQDPHKFQPTSDYENYSVQLAQASKEIFAAFFDKSKADNYSFKYTGHGAGQGGLFETLVGVADAHQLLKTVVSMNGNRKFAFIDFNTDCYESSVRTLDQVTPYADYVLASEFTRGGYTPACQNSSEECFQHDLFEHSQMSLLFFFNHTRTMRDSLISIVNLKENEFYTNRIEINKEGTLFGFIYVPRQSVTLVDSSSYSILKGLLQNSYDQNPIDYSNLVSTVNQSAVQNKKSGVYDLGAFAKNLGAQTNIAFTQTVTAYARSFSDQPLLWDASGITFHMMIVGINLAFDKADFTSDKNMRDKALADKALADKALADKALADKASKIVKATITCAKGKVLKKVTGSKPVCPKGFKKS